MNGRFLVAAAGLAMLPACVYGAGARVYEVIELGSIGRSSVATKISESGFVTGYTLPSNYPTGRPRAFLWSKSSGMQDLGSYQTNFTSWGTAVDDNGAVGGISFPGVGTTPIYKAGPGFNWVDLSSVAPNGQGWRLGAPVGMDAATGRIVFETGYTWAPGESVARQLGSGINNASASAGEFAAANYGHDTTSRAAVWTASHGIVDVHTGLGSDASYAAAISKNGMTAFVTRRINSDPGPQPNNPTGGPPVDIYAPRGVVGVVDPRTGAISRRVDLGLVQELKGVNDWGHAVGVGIGAADGNPTLFRDGRQYKANDLLRPGSGWTISELTDINTHGEVVGVGFNAAGEQRAIMMRLAAPPQQVQNDTRTDPAEAWGTKSYLGHSSYTIGAVGCFLASTSMILNTFGHEVNPNQLNDFLTPEMPTKGSMSFGDIPRTVTSYGQDPEAGEGVPVHFKSHRFTGQTEQALVNEIKALTEEHGPIILRVPYWSRDTRTFDYANGTHAIVAYRVEDGEVLVRNPGSYHSGISEDSLDSLTLAQYIQYENNRFANVERSITPDLSWLRDSRSWATYGVATSVEDMMHGAMHSPVEFVITDPEGRRLGFDPTANNGEGEFYNEIPDSFYARLNAIATQDGERIGEEYAPIDFYIADLIAGDYQIEFFAIGDGDWEFSFDISNSLGLDPQEFAFEGTTDDLLGGYSVVITYVPVPAPGAFGLLGLCLVASMRRSR